jgi:Hypothetical protein (DUF2513)
MERGAGRPVEGKQNTMNRDAGLQTKILQALRDAGPNEMIPSLDGYSDEAFWYNARQLHRAGLIDIMDRGTIDNPLQCWATGLTPYGHDVLDRAKDEWRDKGKAAGGRVLQITFESVLREILDKLIP